VREPAALIGPQPGFWSVPNLAGHTSEQRSDVVIKLDSNDQLILRNPMISHKLRLTLLLSAMVSIGLSSQSAVRADAAKWMVIQPGALVWAPFAELPAGTDIAVLYGDPSKAEAYAVRLKFPKGYEVANHSHPTDESITVISGKLFMAFGKNNPGRAGSTALVSGSFMMLPAGSFHHLWAEADTVVEIHSTGPSGIKLAK
jgi:quercetin dioxygenase-like cupin family protein